MQRKTSRDKGPAPPPPIIPQQSTNKEDKGPAPLPPVPLPILPTPPSSPLTPPSTPPFQLKIEEPNKQREEDKAEEEQQEGGDVQEMGESSKTTDANPDILDVAYNKILSLEKSTDYTDESILMTKPEAVTVTSPEQGLNSIVVNTQEKKNTSTIIISDVADPSNSLASNISQVTNSRSTFKNCIHIQI